MTSGGSLNARLHRILLPVRSQVALKDAGGGGLSVFGSTDSRAVTGAERTMPSPMISTTDLATCVSDGRMPYLLESDDRVMATV
jgi:hypothetical protein